jgi:hypothetical protein
MTVAFFKALAELKKSYKNSPEPSFKVSNYFTAYVEIFSHLRGTDCTFIETGILNGGSLFMWRDWLGPQARIIGVDLNPSAQKWREYGFEIVIGDQGDPAFWDQAFDQLGSFDALLDDGGHQSFQQIITLNSALRAARNSCVIAVEDTCTSFMKEFSRHRNRSFLEYAKATTDVLVSNTTHFFEGEFPQIDNPEIVDEFSKIYSINFYSGLVAFKVDPALSERPELVWNRPQTPTHIEPDFRYEGASEATVNWPNPFMKEIVTVRGGRG